MNNVIAGFYLSTEIERRKAFLKCIEHADSEFPEAMDYNAFLKYAAEQLGQPAVVKPIIKRLCKETEL